MLKIMLKAHTKFQGSVYIVIQGGGTKHHKKANPPKKRGVTTGLDIRFQANLTLNNYCHKETT